MTLRDFINQGGDLATVDPTMLTTIRDNTGGRLGVVRPFASLLENDPLRTAEQITPTFESPCLDRQLAASCEEDIALYREV